MDGRNGGGSTPFAEMQRCIIMDVLRTDFDGLASSELTVEPAAAARQPDTASVAPAVKCIGRAAQDALDEVRVLPDITPDETACCMAEYKVVKRVWLVWMKSTLYLA